MDATAATKPAAPEGTVAGGAATAAPPPPPPATAASLRFDHATLATTITAAGAEAEGAVGCGKRQRQQQRPQPQPDEQQSEHEKARMRRFVDESIRATCGEEERSAYETARTLRPDVVLAESDPVWYVAREGGDIDAAAQRLTRYWTKRRAIFDENRFHLPLLYLPNEQDEEEQEEHDPQTAMSVEDTKVFRTGYLTLLPEMDGKQVVILDCEIIEKHGLMQTLETRTRRFRCNLFLHTILSTQSSKPIIFIRFSSSSIMNAATAANAFEVYRCLPIRVHAFYNVFLPPCQGARRTFENTIAPVFENHFHQNLLIESAQKQEKAVVRIVTNSKAAVYQEYLSKSGFQTDGLPPSLGGTWSYQNHAEWCTSLQIKNQKQQQQEQQKQPPLRPPPPNQSQPPLPMHVDNDKEHKTKDDSQRTTTVTSSIGGNEQQQRQSITISSQQQQQQQQQLQQQLQQQQDGDHADENDRNAPTTKDHNNWKGIAETALRDFLIEKAKQVQVQHDDMTGAVTKDKNANAASAVASMGGGGGGVPPPPPPPQTATVSEEFGGNRRVVDASRKAGGVTSGVPRTAAVAAASSSSSSSSTTTVRCPAAAASASASTATAHASASASTTSNATCPPGMDRHTFLQAQLEEQRQRKREMDIQYAARRRLREKNMVETLREQHKVLSARHQILKTEEKRLLGLMVEATSLVSQYKIEKAGIGATIPPLLQSSSKSTKATKKATAKQRQPTKTFAKKSVSVQRNEIATKTTPPERKRQRQQQRQWQQEQPQHQQQQSHGKPAPELKRKQDAKPSTPPTRLQPKQGEKRRDPSTDTPRAGMKKAQIQNKGCKSNSKGERKQPPYTVPAAETAAPPNPLKKRAAEKQLEPKLQKANGGTADFSAVLRQEQVSDPHPRVAAMRLDRSPGVVLDRTIQRTQQQQGLMQPSSLHVGQRQPFPFDVGAFQNVTVVPGSFHATIPPGSQQQLQQQQPTIGSSIISDYLAALSAQNNLQAAGQILQSAAPSISAGAHPELQSALGVMNATAQNPSAQSRIDGALRVGNFRGISSVMAPFHQQDVFQARGQQLLDQLLRSRGGQQQRGQQYE